MTSEDRQLVSGKNLREDELPSYWLGHSHSDLAQTVAELHKQRNELAMSIGYNEVMAHRRAMSFAFISGSGIEVGAGDRPWPVSDIVNVFYGDTRDKESLGGYFKNNDVQFDGHIDAQSFRGIPDSTLDFVISGHVIEHLADPITSISNTIRVLKSNGIFLLAVPDMDHTHDRNRPPTTIEHLLADSVDGGSATRYQAYEDHVRYVHTFYHPPIAEDDIEREIRKISDMNMDIHWHAWTGNTFREMLETIAPNLLFTIIAHVPVQNENIFVLRKI